MVNLKAVGDIEAHIDPYGECLLYPGLVEVVRGTRAMEGVARISLQTNGSALDEKTTRSLVDAGLDQVNITLNTLNDELARKLACKEDYSVASIQQSINISLEQGLDVVITPVWFFKKNDEDIEDIIVYYKELKESNNFKGSLQLGIQNYLVYKTGRKLSRVREREFVYFYKRLKALEKKHGVKLLIGPSDFKIHPAPTISPAFIDYHDWERDTIEVEILEKGRNDKEYIGRIGDWGVKVVAFTHRKPAKTERIPAGDFKIKGKHLITAYLKD